MNPITRTTPSHRRIKTPVATGLTLAIALIGFLAAGGCTPRQGPDSNPTDVARPFRTAGEVSEVRRKELLASLRSTAVSVVGFYRPDIHAMASEPLSITLEADGCKKTIDLSGLEPQLIQKDARTREIIRGYIEPQLPAFDQERLKGMGFERAAKLITPWLCNSGELEALTRPLKPAGGFQAIPIIAALCWTPVVQFPGTEQSIVPIGDEVRTAWKISFEKTVETALANIRPALTPDAIETINIGMNDKIGRLRTGINPAVIVLPEFLPTARKAWKSDDNLVVVLMARTSITLMEAGHKKFLDSVLPRTLAATEKMPDALCRAPLLLDDNGFSAFKYEPTTKPATKPAATRPKPYVVH